VITPPARGALRRIRNDRAAWANALAERYTEADLATALAVLRRLADPDGARDPQPREDAK
jgi:hypothetical protein